MCDYSALTQPVCTHISVAEWRNISVFIYPGNISRSFQSNTAKRLFQGALLNSTVIFLTPCHHYFGLLQFVTCDKNHQLSTDQMSFFFFNWNKLCCIIVININHMPITNHPSATHSHRCQIEMIHLHTYNCAAENCLCDSHTQNLHITSAQLCWTMKTQLSPALLQQQEPAVSR